MMMRKFREKCLGKIFYNFFRTTCKGFCCSTLYQAFKILICLVLKIRTTSVFIPFRYSILYNVILRKPKQALPVDLLLTVI